LASEATTKTTIAAGRRLKAVRENNKQQNKNKLATTNRIRSRSSI
jgi:hypothetical protein